MITLRDDVLAAVIERWKCDPGGTYQTWFVWAERIKNFRSIRRGLEVVVNGTASRFPHSQSFVGRPRTEQTEAELRVARLVPLPEPS